MQGPNNPGQKISLELLSRALIDLSTSERYLKISQISFWLYLEKFRTFSTDLPIEQRYNSLKSSEFAGYNFIAERFGSINRQDWQVIQNQLANYKPEILIPILLRHNISKPEDLTPDLTQLIVMTYITQLLNEA